MKQQTDFTSISVFLFSSFIILFSSVSIIFPALLFSIIGGTESTLAHPFEMGIFAIPLILVNISFFTLYFLITKKFSNLKNIIIKIISLDIPKKFGIISVIAIITIYATLSFPETLEPEPWPDFNFVLTQYDGWLGQPSISENLTQFHTKMFFLYVSEQVFDNFRILPLLASISLLFLIYTFTVKITSKQLPGIIAVLITIQSGIFRLYDTTPTYANFWVVFHLLSIYLIEKSSHTSFLSYFTSIFAKPLTFAFLPFNIFYILRTSLPLRKKLLALVPYLIIAVLVFLIVFIFFPDSELNSSNILFHPPRFLSGFTILSYQLRFDIFIMMSLIPINFLLYKKSLLDKRAQSLMIFVSGIILVGPLLTGFFNYMLNPYRLIPLVVFFAISVGYLFSRIPLRNNNLK